MSEGKELIKEGIDRSTVDAARALEADKYAEGFVTDFEMELAPKGLNEDTVRYISTKKEEPDWMLTWRLEAFQRWKEMTEPTWAMVHYPKIDYQDAHYYAAPKGAAKYKTIDEVIERANASEYGLGGTVWSKSTERAVEVAKRLQTGTVWINKHLDLPPSVPYGGVKQSGFGVELGQQGLEEFTQLRILNIAK